MKKKEIIISVATLTAISGIAYYLIQKKKREEAENIPKQEELEPIDATKRKYITLKK